MFNLSNITPNHLGQPRSCRPDKGDPALGLVVLFVKEVIIVVDAVVVEEGQPVGAALWRTGVEQEGAAADPVHQQRLRQPPRLHPQRPLRHKTLQDQGKRLMLKWIQTLIMGSMCLDYRATQQILDLGWVDFDFGYSTIFLPKSTRDDE